MSGFFNYGFINPGNDIVPSGLRNDPVFGSRSAWTAAGQWGGVIFTQPAEIDAFKAAITASNPGYRPQLSLAAQPYLVFHSPDPRSQGTTLGRSYLDTNGNRVYGCTDCHNNADGIFNGSYDLLGTGKRISDNTDLPLTVSWNDPSDVTAQAPAWDRNLNMLIVDFTDPAARSTRTPGKREFLGYDSVRVAALNAVTPVGSGIGIKPKATINPITDLDPYQPGIQVLVNTAVPFTAPDAQTYQGTPVGYVTYTWATADPTATTSSAGGIVIEGSPGSTRSRPS